MKEKEDKKEKKEFVEPELVKHEDKLDEVTMQNNVATVTDAVFE